MNKTRQDKTRQDKTRQDKSNLFDRFAKCFLAIKQKTAIRTRLQYYRNCLTGKRCLLIKNIHKKLAILGNRYGRYAVAKGLMSQNSVCLTFGVGEDISFELELMKLFNAKVFAFDPTPRAIAFVEKTVGKDQDFVFFPYGLDIKDGFRNFTVFDDDNPEASGNILDGETVRIRDKTIIAPMKSFASCLELLPDNTVVDILKMDIEGTEFIMLPEILRQGYSPKQILVETHERFYKNAGRKMKIVRDALFSYGYRIVYLSPAKQVITFILQK